MSNVKHKQKQENNQKDNLVYINPSDYSTIIDAMDKYSDLDYMLFGENSEKEFVTMSIWPDYIVVDTLQKNGWTRRNVYWRDGFTEELYSKDGTFK